MYKWFNIWLDDKKSVLDTMVKNLMADLDAGYDYFSYSVSQQRRLIDSYKEDFDRELRNLSDMDCSKAERWCYVDLRRRGTIC